MKYITTARFSHNKIQGDLFGGAGTIIAKYYVLSDGGGILQSDPSIDINKLYEDRPILVSYTRKEDNTNNFFKMVTGNPVIVIACNDDIVINDARDILNQKLPEKPVKIPFDAYMEVLQALKVEVFKNAGEADAYSRGLRLHFPDNCIFLSNDQFNDILLYNENFTQIPADKINFFPDQKDIVVKEATAAYKDAISKNLLSDNENADNYAGLYRYMFSDTNGINYFKHLDTREFIKTAA